MPLDPANLWPLNLIGTRLLCVDGIFSIDLTSPMLCRSSLFLAYVRKKTFPLHEKMSIRLG